MVKVIMGLKGSGKTKQLIELVHKAVSEDKCVICIEKDPTLRYDIPSQARHVYTSKGLYKWHARGQLRYNRYIYRRTL